MPTSRGFHDLLFEVSNESRYEILVLLREKPMRNTDISKELDLTSPETRRQVSRLGEVGLIQRDLEGFYHLTPYGEMSLILFQEFHFITRNREYFQTHSTNKVPAQFVKRIGELGESTSLGNTIDFIRFTEGLFKESNEYVWLLVDQFPLNSLATIIDAIGRGVQFKIIEPMDRVLSPDIESLTSEETQALDRARHTPLVHQKMLDEVSAYIYLSEKRCVLAFPDSNDQNDYRGFTATDDVSLIWCRELFEHYWGESEKRTLTEPDVQVRRRRVSERGEALGQIAIVGTENPSVDAQTVQDAVDNYDEVILKGAFNFGTSMVQITRSVAITGHGRENDIPSTTIYKKGWRFPFTEFDSVFKVDGEGADVTIENLQFTDFNHTCIWGVQCNSLNVKKNRITLMTGFGRGMAYGAFGDAVIGIWVRGSELNPFKGRVTVEGNEIDFARGGAFGGFLARGGLEEDPEYRPDLFNHEYYIGVGIGVQNASNFVSIEDNVIRNTNARGIAATDNLSSADVRIKNNTIISDLYGSYPFSSPEAGAGIVVQSAWGFPSPGFNVEIEGNTIRLDKLNHSGIKVLGAVMSREGADKLRGGSLRDNSITLGDGYEGIHVSRCDDFEVVNNVILGEAYYGIRLSGRRGSEALDLRSLNNVVEGNDMSGLRIKDPDGYSDSHADGRIFAGSTKGAATAHVWLDMYSGRNEIGVGKDVKVIDDGEDNRVLTG